MRRLLYLATLCLLCSAVFASAALAQSRGPSGADGTYNCEDFDDQGQAQEFFNGAGADDGLDDDGDGLACESLPTVVNDGTPEGAAVPGKGEAPVEEKAEAKAGGTEAKAEEKAVEQKQAEAKAEEKQAEAKVTEQKKAEAKKELPKTGGNGASLPALGAGALLVGGGLLVRKVVR